MVVVGAVGKVEPGHTHSSPEQLFQDLNATTHRSQCAYHLPQCQPTCQDLSMSAIPGGQGHTSFLKEVQMLKQTVTAC